MGSIEGFTQLPQGDYFGTKDNYTCQTQTIPTCVYTAQGELVCTAGGNQQAPGGVNVERFSQSNTRT